MTEPLCKRRARVVVAALSQIGLRDPLPYWRDVLPGRTSFPRSWCGAGYLWCLHQASLATQVSWQIGLGLPGAMQRYGLRMPQTVNPEPGDLAYFTRNQHHAVVIDVIGHNVDVVNFNGTGRKVTRTVHPFDAVRAFYSIAELIEREEEETTEPMRVV